MFAMKNTLARINIRLDTTEKKIIELEDKTSVIKSSLEVKKQSPSLVLITGNKF